MVFLLSQSKSYIFFFYFNEFFYDFQMIFVPTLSLIWNDFACDFFNDFFLLFVWWNLKVNFTITVSKKEPTNFSLYFFIFFCNFYLFFCLKKLLFVYYNYIYKNLLRKCFLFFVLFKLILQGALLRDFDVSLPNFPND